MRGWAADCRDESRRTRVLRVDRVAAGVEARKTKPCLGPGSDSRRYPIESSSFEKSIPGVTILGPDAIVMVRSSGRYAVP